MPSNPFTNGCDPVDLPEGTCVGVADALEVIVTAGHDAILPFYSEACPPVGYTSHGLASDHVNGVVAWLGTMNLGTPGASGKAPLIPRATLITELSLGPFPNIWMQDGQIMLPDPAAVSTATYTANAIAETWYRSVVSAVRRSSVCSQPDFSAMQPQPLGSVNADGHQVTVAAFQFSITVAL